MTMRHAPRNDSKGHAEGNGEPQGKRVDRTTGYFASFDRHRDQRYSAIVVRQS